MENWVGSIFRIAGLITKSAGDLDHAISLLVAMARKEPKLFDDSQYLNRVEKHDFRKAFAAALAWSIEGLEQLKSAGGWDFLLLDLGDCPESFRLYRPAKMESLAESQFLSAIGAQPPFQPYELLNAAPLARRKSEDRLLGAGEVTLIDQHVQHLRDPLLDWTANKSVNFHGNSGYLLWLTFGSLALSTVLSSPDHRGRILNGRDRLYVLTGFEEIFCHLGTATSDAFTLGGK